MDELALHGIEARDVELLDELVALDPLLDRHIQRDVQPATPSKGVSAMHRVPACSWIATISLQPQPASAPWLAADARGQDPTRFRRGSWLVRASTKDG